MLRSQIIGTGQYLPERVLTNHDLEKMMDTSDEWIRQRTGIVQRHVADTGEGTSDIGIPAARLAIEAAGILPTEIDLLICCTLFPDYHFPATACGIQHGIGATRAAVFDLNAACSGFIYSLAAADAFIRAGVYKTVLIVGAEAMTKLINWSKRDTAVLFGDGGGAVVLRGVEGERGVLSTYLAADGSCGDILMVPAGCSKMPITSENVSGPERDIQMKGLELFRKAVAAFGDASQRALEQTGLSVDDIDLFVPHQANNRIIQAAAERLQLPREKVFVNIERMGNTSAASIPIALDEASRGGRLKPGDIILTAAFGAGLTWGSAIIRW